MAGCRRFLRRAPAPRLGMTSGPTKVCLTWAGRILVFQIDRSCHLCIAGSDAAFIHSDALGPLSEDFVFATYPPMLIALQLPYRVGWRGHGPQGHASAANCTTPRKAISSAGALAADTQEACGKLQSDRNCAPPLGRAWAKLRGSCSGHLRLLKSRAATLQHSFHATLMPSASNNGRLVVECKWGVNFGCSAIGWSFWA